MDDRIVELIAGELEQEHRGSLLAANRDPLDERLTQEAVDEAVRRAVAMLPDGAAWAIAKDAPAVIALTTDDVVFVVVVRQDQVVEVRSRPLNGRALIVKCVWGPPRPGAAHIARDVSWTFRYRGQDEDDLEEWQYITGGTTFNQDREMETDRRETLARTIASRVGWNLVG